VGATRCRTGRDGLANLIPADVEICREFVDHEAEAIVTVRSNLLHLVGKNRVVRVDAITQEVDAPRNGPRFLVDYLGTQFNSRQQSEPRPREGVSSFLEATHGVVIRQRQDINPCGPSVPDELRGSVIAVRGGGVGVKIDDCWHASMLGARLERWPSLPPLHLGRIARRRPFRRLSATIFRPVGLNTQPNLLRHCPMCPSCRPDERP